MWNGAGSAIANDTAVQVIGLSIVSGATQTNVVAGAQYCATTKKAGDSVILQVTLKPDTDAAAAVVTWSGGSAVTGQPRQRSVDKGAAGWTQVTATAGTSSATMNVYVVWADIYAQISGSISDGNDAMKISPPARVWPPSLGGGSLLGTLDHDANNALTYRYAIGKIQISAFLTPSQASAVIDRTKWDIKRTVTAAAWDNGGHYVNGEWQQGPSLSVANMDDTSPAVWKDVDPLSGTSTGQLYDLDAAGCSVALPGTTINHTSEIYVNFTQWATVTLDTSYKVSDNVIWSWQAQVDGDKPAGSRVELNQLSTQAINIPGAPHYAQR